ncbi:hypothetical protein LZ198_38055 [Myxococcus sp. K15C18031901]|uniref:hypothetical protein n=1 Tax=Myxococcus dinghuensis TaxID=2906761 RepID=UPI0020A76FBC|nr:hypothetical protein [Myxococcus dinghuensis]MCP3104685.1 hypothetical protein [Myxococcus dinghuensis]
MLGELGRGRGDPRVGQTRVVHGAAFVETPLVGLFEALGRWAGVPGHTEVERAGGTSLAIQRVDAGTVRVLVGPPALLSGLAPGGGLEDVAVSGPPGEVQAWSGRRVDFRVDRPEGVEACRRLLTLGVPPEEGRGGRLATVRRVTGAWSFDRARGTGREESVFTTYDADGREDFVHTALLGEVSLRTRGRVEDATSHVYEATLTSLAPWALEPLRQLHPRSAAHGDTVVLVLTAEEAERLRQGARDWVWEVASPDVAGGRQAPEWLEAMARMETAEEAMAVLLTPSHGAALQVAERLVMLGLFIGEAEVSDASGWA